MVYIYGTVISFVFSQISLVIQQIRALILHSEVDSVQQSLTNMTIEVCNKVTDMEVSL